MGRFCRGEGRRDRSFPLAQGRQLFFGCAKKRGALAEFSSQGARAFLLIVVPWKKQRFGWQGFQPLNRLKHLRVTSRGKIGPAAIANEYGVAAEEKWWAGSEALLRGNKVGDRSRAMARGGQRLDG